MKRPDISIIASGINAADARLHRICSALSDAGFSIEIFAPGATGDAPRQTKLAKVSQSKNFAGRIHRALTSPIKARGRVIFAISPEAAAPSWIWAKISGRKFAIDLYEDYLELIKDRAWAKNSAGAPAKAAVLATWIAKTAIFFARRADITTVADQQVRPHSARKRLVLRNLPDMTLLHPAGVHSKTPTAIYIGDIRRSRGLFTMLEAIKLAPAWRVEMIGPVAATDQGELDIWLKENPDAAARIFWHGRLIPAQAWRFAEGAWVGLSLLDHTPAFIAAVPSKLYEYQAVGLATISTSLPRCEEILRASGGGLIADTPEEVSKVLNDWAENPAQAENMAAAARAYAEENLSWSIEAAPFISEMAKLLKAVK
jgi:glycosyltransferase involved in cell wall biosynthesis